MIDYKENLILDKGVLRTLEYLQNDHTVIFYDSLLAKVIRAAIEDPDAFPDDEAIDIVRGLHNLRKALRDLVPSAMLRSVDPSGLPALPESIEEGER